MPFRNNLDQEAYAEKKNESSREGYRGITSCSAGESVLLERVPAPQQPPRERLQGFGGDRGGVLDGWGRDRGIA